MPGRPNYGKFTINNHKQFKTNPYEKSNFMDKYYPDQCSCI